MNLRRLLRQLLGGLSFFGLLSQLPALRPPVWLAVVVVLGNPLFWLE